MSLVQFFFVIFFLSSCAVSLIVIACCLVRIETCIRRCDYHVGRFENFYLSPMMQLLKDTFGRHYVKVIRIKEKES